MAFRISLAAGGPAAAKAGAFTPVRLRLVRRVALLVLVIAAALVLVVSLRPRPQREVQLDLGTMLDAAEIRTTLPSPQAAVRREAVTINGVREEGIYAHPWTRISFPLVVPRNGRFEADVGILPEAWRMGGDGVTFRVGLSAGAEYQTLFTIYIDPKHDEHDRQWQPVTIDLSRWAGREVKLILSTDAGPKSDPIADWAFWGTPVVSGREYTR